MGTDVVICFEAVYWYLFEMTRGTSGLVVGLVADVFG